MTDNVLVAIYETKRQNLLTAFIQNPDRFDPALAYAYEKRLAPIFHEDIARETYGSDPFADIYAVKADFMDEVLTYIDDRALAKDFDAIQFYNLEAKFGGHHSNRVELLHTIEYARIARRFSDEVYTAIESNAPIEANSIDATFEPKDVYFG